MPIAFKANLYLHQPHSILYFTFHKLGVFFSIKSVHSGKLTLNNHFWGIRTRGHPSLCSNEVPLSPVPITSVRTTPKRGTRSSRSYSVWVGRGWHVSLPLPFKSHWGCTSRAGFSLTASYIWPRHAFSTSIFGRGVKKTLLWVQESGLFESSWRQKKELVPVPFSILTAFGWHIESHLYRLEYTQECSSPSLPTVYMSQCRSLYFKRLHVIQNPHT